MILKAYCVIINHICPEHGPETMVMGPFVTQAEAENFRVKGCADTGTPLDDTRVEMLGLNAKNVERVIIANMVDGMNLPGIDGPVH